jgi:hypothetical protein
MNDQNKGFTLVCNNCNRQINLATAEVRSQGLFPWYWSRDLVARVTRLGNYYITAGCICGNDPNYIREVVVDDISY